LFAGNKPAKAPGFDKPGAAIENLLPERLMTAGIPVETEYSSRAGSIDISAPTPTPPDLKSGLARIS
jgi:hypothetical protein